MCELMRDASLTYCTCSHILWLDVAMSYALAVNVLETSDELSEVEVGEVRLYAYVWRDLVK